MAQSNSEKEAAKPHQTSDGFRNNYVGERSGFGDVLKWQWQRFWHVEVTPIAFPLAANDPEYLRHNRTEPTLTWIGHASFLLQFDGLNILTDPHMSQRASPLSWMGPSRKVAPGLAFEDLPPIDLVILSHNHYDHLDQKTIEKIHHQQKGHSPRFFVPLGLKAWFAKLGIEDVVELDWWETSQLGDLALHAVPVQHFSGRGPIDSNKTLWAGWVLEWSNFTFFFAGDTGYSADFKDIGMRWGGFDLSAIPIGAYLPRWFMQTVHVTPEEAVEIHRDVQSRYSVGMHWGTFVLSDKPMDEPPGRLRAALKEMAIPSEQFFMMQHGETRDLSFLFETEAE